MVLVEWDVGVGVFIFWGGKPSTACRDFEWLQMQCAWAAFNGVEANVKVSFGTGH